MIVLAQFRIFPGSICVALNAALGRPAGLSATTGSLSCINSTFVAFVAENPKSLRHLKLASLTQANQKELVLKALNIKGSLQPP